jgi:hypothetical protein
MRKPQGAKEIWSNQTIESAISEVIRTIRRYERTDSGPALFPGGITKIRLNVTVTGMGSFEVEVSGPDRATNRSYQERSEVVDWLFYKLPLPTLSIGDLNLAPNAKAAAEALQKEFPDDVFFTSGRRTVMQQASAMAPNVAANRNWIKETYVQSPERDELQSWVDNHPEASDAKQIADGLGGVMNGWDEGRQRKFSRHITGDAFDVRPVAGAVGDRIKGRMPMLPHVNKVFFKEGGLEIWHAQFDA